MKRLAIARVGRRIHPYTAFGPGWAVFGEWMKNDRIEVDGYLDGVDLRF